MQLNITHVTYHGIMEERKDRPTHVLGDMGWGGLRGFGFDLVVCNVDRKGFWLMPSVLLVLSSVLLLPTVCRGHHCDPLCAKPCLESAFLFCFCFCSARSSEINV